MAIFAMTELEAVNIILQTIGEAEVTSIEDITIEDAQMALSTLRQVSREFQSQGWHFNTDYDYELAVDGDSKIPVPTTAAHVDPMPDENYDLVKRGDFLYDRENRTFVFPASTSVDCTVIWLLDFEDMPQTAREYVTYRAARRFAKNVMGDEATVQYSLQDEQQARANFVADEARRSDHNMVTGSWSTARMFYRRRGLIGRS